MSEQEAMYQIPTSETQKLAEIEAVVYEMRASDAIDHAKDRDPVQNLDAMKGFLDAVDWDNLKSRKGDVYPGNVMSSQLLAFEEGLNAPAADRSDPFMLIPRHGGLRSAFGALVANEATAGPFMKALEEKLHTVESIGSAEVMGEKAAHDLGSQAIEAVQLLGEVPMTTTELTKDLSEDDRWALREFAEAVIGKREAQQAGDGQRSTVEGQAMGQAFRRMSPAAAAMKNQFVSSYRS